MKTRNAKRLIAILMVFCVTVNMTLLSVQAAEDWDGYKAAVVAEIDESIEHYDAIVAEINALTTASAGNLFAAAKMAESILAGYGLTTSVDVSDYIETISFGRTKPNVVITESSKRDSLIIAKGEIYGAPEGYLLTMTVDGVEKAMIPGEYQNVVFTVTPETGFMGSYAGRGADPYRAALFIRNGEIAEEYSVLTAVSGNYNSTSADGLVIDSESPSFTSVMIVDSDYTLSNVTINARTASDGRGDANDFSGLGAVVGVYGDSRVVIEEAAIYTSGVAQPALFFDNGAAVLVKKSEVFADGGQLYDGYLNTADQTLMVSPPWVLGIGGNSRTTNIMGKNTLGAYVDSTIGARNWGALSTDAGKNMAIYTINTTVDVEETGYGTYIIGNAQEYFYGTKFNVATYASILTGGAATYTSYTGGEAIDITQVDDTVAFKAVVSELVPAGEMVNTVINSEAFGIMAHNYGTINVEKGTEFNTKDTIFLLKSKGVEINVDNSALNAGNGVILQVMDNDDADVGVWFEESGAGPFFNKTYQEKKGYPGIDYEAPGIASEETAVTVANLTNGEYQGDFYNSSGYTQSAITLDVNLGKGSTLTGVISATSAIHWYDGVQQTSFPQSEYYKIGRLANQVNHNGSNDVNITMTDGAQWNITGDCHVTSINIVDGTIAASEAVTVYYTGDINVPGDIANVTFVKSGEGLR